MAGSGTARSPRTPASQLPLYFSRGADFGAPHGRYGGPFTASWEPQFAARTFPSWNALKTTFPRSPRARVAGTGPGACGEMECGDGSEFVQAGKRDEVVEPRSLSLGCGFEVRTSYTIAVIGRE